MLQESSAAPRYLRYRGIERVANHKPKPEYQEPTPNQNNDVSRHQSLARYRRPRGVTKADSSSSAPTQIVSPSKCIEPAETPQVSEPLETELRPVPSRGENDEAIVWTEHKESQGEGEEEENALESLTETKELIQCDEEPSENVQTELDEINQEVTEQKLSPQSPMKTSVAVQEIESPSLTAEKAMERLKLEDLGHLQVALTTAPTMPRRPPQLNLKKNKLIDLFSKKAESAYTPPSTPKNSNSSIMTKSSLGSQQSRGIEQGGRGIVPQFDAPISAANAKERRVLVRYKNSSINLPVSLKTTPIDIIQSAADTMIQEVLPSTAVLLESYASLGLERRLRSYERIRDVMNSWDRDTQNALVLVQDTLDIKLMASHVPSKVPTDHNFNLYHSQKPGKWNRRHVTLLASGQMFIAKKANAKSTDKDYLNICHLSDFDIYKPKSQLVQRSLSPPKKNCCAIKSQQKTTMFLNTENFVHYFSTDDDALAESFHRAVQQWRSWFLVNCMGGGKATHSTPAQASVDKANPEATQSFQPLLYVNTSDDMNMDGEDTFDSRPLQIPFHYRNSCKYFSQTPEEDSGEFLSSSLLGRTYSERKREIEDSAQIRPRRSLRRPGTATSASSRCQTQSSLLDFTSSKEPPQWSRQVKGHGIRPVVGGPLIDVATTPSFMRDNMQSSTSVYRLNDGRTLHTGKLRTGSVKASEGPFVRGGLITGGVGVLGNNARSYSSRFRR